MGFPIFWNLVRNRGTGPSFTSPSPPPHPTHRRTLVQTNNQSLILLRAIPTGVGGVSWEIRRGWAAYSFCFVRACFLPSSPQSPHRVFASSELIFPPAAHRALCYSMVYIKTVKNGNRLFVSLSCTSFRNKCSFRKIANLVNALAIHDQQIVVKTFQMPPAAHRAHTEPLCQQPCQGLFSPLLPT